MTDEAKKTNPPEDADAPKDDNPSPEEEKEGGPEIPEVLPLLPVRDIVIFPYITLPLFVGGKVPSPRWTRRWRGTGTSSSPRRGTRPWKTRRRGTSTAPARWR